MSTPQRKPGQPSKGDRAVYSIRPPRAHMQTYKAEAARHGLQLSDYLVLVLARSHNLEEPEYIHRSGHNQPDLLASS